VFSSHIESFKSCRQVERVLDIQLTMCGAGGEQVSCDWLILWVADLVIIVEPIRK